MRVKNPQEHARRMAKRAESKIKKRGGRPIPPQATDKIDTSASPINKIEPRVRPSLKRRESEIEQVAKQLGVDLDIGR